MSVLYSAFGWILYHIYSLVGNYGIAIILFTILFKVILLPLNLKQTRSMKETQAIQPEIKKLQKKYKNNPEKLNQETQKLYKLYNVNPLAGCLPLLLQLPIIYGLFGCLRNPSEYVFCYGELIEGTGGFLWIPDLGATDPYYILPVLCAIFTFLMQKVTSKYQQNADPSMEMTTKMMTYLMPIIIGFAAIRMPAGVALYWVVQNIFTLVQQWICMRKPVELIPLEEAEKKLEESKKEEKDSKKKQRQYQAQMRENAMRSKSSGASKEKSGENYRPKTKPASGKVVRKTITKIPQQKSDSEARSTITKIPGQENDNDD